MWLSLVLHGVLVGFGLLFGGHGATPAEAAINSCVSWGYDLEDCRKFAKYTACFYNENDAEELGLAL